MVEYNIGLGSPVVNHLVEERRLTPGSWHRGDSSDASVPNRLTRQHTIPDVPLGILSQEFYDWDLKLFEPLLRADLHLPEGTSLNMAPWTTFAGESPDEYRRQVPSLAEVRKRLQLETKN